MKRAVPSQRNSLRPFFLFCGVVLFFVFGSLTFKTFQSVRESIYDPSHHFVLAVRSSELLSLYSIDPSEKEIRTVHVKTNGEKIDAGKALGVAVDATVTSPLQGNDQKRLSETLPHLLVHNENLTWFDVVRMMLVTKSMSESDDTASQITYDKKNDYSFETTFTDQDIISEKVSLGVVNATGKEGVGRRLERVVASLGGTVVSVTTAQDMEEKSYILTASDTSYTLRRIVRLLPYPVRIQNQESVSDILIVLGKDALTSTVF